MQPAWTVLQELSSLGMLLPMTSMNKTYAKTLEALGIRFPRLLMPAPEVPIETWGVVACDQHTSDRDYWNRLSKAIGSNPSTLPLIFPEVYLEDPDRQDRIQRIHQTMQHYLDQGLLQDVGEQLIYIERTTEASGLRQGILLAMDLEYYDYSKGSTSLIRATEGTILDRIPPRVQVRKGAPLELPHIMILIDDPDQGIIEPLASQKNSDARVYTTDLLLGGGRIEGYSIKDSGTIQTILSGLQNLAAADTTRKRYGTDTPLLFAMGDGNHSLATAKTVWEELKAAAVQEHGTWEHLADHPARFALAEIVNLHSPGLRFEPIHRTLFGVSGEELQEVLKGDFNARITPMAENTLQAFLEGNPAGQKAAGVYDGDQWYSAEFPEDEERLPNALVDLAFETLRSRNPKATIDFIHGWNHTKNFAKQGSAVSTFFPVIARDRLFDYVINQGSLPRKAFSMGDAEEKRYYIESRRILPS